MKRAFLIPLIFMGCSAIGGGDGAPEVSMDGAVCGVPTIKGEMVGSVDGPGACGVENAVRLTSVGGIALSQSSTMNCETARVLDGWVQAHARPTVGETGGGLTGLRVAAHYACRTRNSRSGAKLSEHAKGNAIDIAAFQLADGSEISVLKDWRGGKRSKILRALHGSACGPFGTVLGPKSDRHHQDHFHFDIASYRSGAYCR